MEFLRLDLDDALSVDPQAGDQAGHHLVRLIAGNPVTMVQMTRHVADAGSYAPVTILIEGSQGGGTRIAYDSVASGSLPTRAARHLVSPGSWMLKCSDCCVMLPDHRKRHDVNERLDHSDAHRARR
jgi:hypothetical protein